MAGGVPASPRMVTMRDRAKVPLSRASARVGPDGTLALSRSAANVTGGEEHPMTYGSEATVPGSSVSGRIYSFLPALLHRSNSASSAAMARSLASRRR
jgi:hypothetical protein